MLIQCHEINFLELAVSCPDIVSLILIKYLFINKTITDKTNREYYFGDIYAAEGLQDVFMIKSSCKLLNKFIKKRNILEQIYSWANVNLSNNYGRDVECYSDIYILKIGCVEYSKVKHSIRCSSSFIKQCKFCKMKTNCLTKASLHASVCFGRVMSCTRQKYNHRYTHQYCTVNGPRLGMPSHNLLEENHNYETIGITCNTVGRHRNFYYYNFYYYNYNFWWL
jgi:hypothetical protein